MSDPHHVLLASIQHLEYLFLLPLSAAEVLSIPPASLLIIQLFIKLITAMYPHTVYKYPRTNNYTAGSNYTGQKDNHIKLLGDPKAHHKLFCCIHQNQHG